MLITILVLQVFMIVFFLVLSIVGWQKLTEKLTEKLEYSTKTLEKLTEKSEHSTKTLTEKLTEKRVSVSYEHVIHYKDGLFKHKVVAAYRMQLLYDGLPIGEPTERIVYRSSKVDKEAVQAAFTGALQALETGIAASGMPLTVLNKIEDVTKVLSK